MFTHQSKVALGAALMVLLFAIPAMFGHAGAVTVDVSIPGFSFSPSTVTVNVGTTVRWTNNHSISHTTTSTTALWDSGILAQGEQFSHVFSSAGTFPYLCTLHLGMTGTVVVYVCGDANASGGDPAVDIDDIVFLINYVFGGGPAPVPLAAGDANCSGGDPAVDIDDIVYLINYVFGGGPAPCANCL